MKYYRKIVGEKTYLSPISIDNAEKWNEWLNDLEISLPLGDEVYTPLSIEKQRELIASSLHSFQHFFNIIELQIDLLIGKCSLYDLNLVDRSASIGIVIGEKDFWNKGYGTDAMNLLLDYGFNLLNLNNIMLNVYSFNEKAYNFYKKIGFREIGRRREARIICGNKYDLIFMDMLSKEYNSVCVKKLLAD